MAPGDTHRAVLALGSNLPPREHHLDLALTRLAEVGVMVRAATERWNTRPVDAPPQPDFLNQLLLVEAAIEDGGWLEAAQRCEGPRRRWVPKGPRELDVDVVLVEGVVSSDSRLVLPHPALGTRPYLLSGASRLVPLWRPLPGGPTVAELARARLPPEWWP